jgi:hypothetical protein
MPRIVPRSCHRTSNSSLEVRMTGIAWGWIVRTWESGSQVRNAKTSMVSIPVVTLRTDDQLGSQTPTKKLRGRSPLKVNQ